MEQFPDGDSFSWEQNLASFYRAKFIKNQQGGRRCSRGKVRKVGQFLACLSWTNPVFGSKFWISLGAFPHLLFFCQQGWIVGSFWHCRAISQIYVNSWSDCWWKLQRIFVAAGTGWCQGTSLFRFRFAVQGSVKHVHQRKLVLSGNMMLN